MRGDGRLEDLFADLEQQADGLALAQRDVEVAEQSRAEYAQVDLAARLHASAGAGVQIRVAGVGALAGVLARVGAGWCLLDAGAQEWVVALSAVASVRGLADRVVAAEGRPVAARLGLGSALRGVTETRLPVVLHLVDGSTVAGAPVRVGADFLEVRVGERPAYVEAVPFAALAAVRTAGP